jgi:replicative DNA helicase
MSHPAFVTQENFAAKVESRLYDSECEVAVLGAILIENSALALIEHQLSASDFHNPRNALVYETMLRLRSTQRPIDIVTLSGELRARERLNTVGGAQMLGELTDAVVTTAYIEAHAQIISDLAVRRRIAQVGMEIVARALGGGASDTADLIKVATEKMGEATRRSGGGSMRTYREVVLSTLARIEATGTDAPVRIKTGLTEVDRILGGFKAAWLYIIGARPAMGKSALALLAAHMAAGERRGTVMVFGLEMEPEENAARWAATTAGVDGRAVMDGEACPEDFTAFAVALCDNEDLPILWNATDDLSIDDIVATCVRQSFLAPIAMVVIDYLTLLRMGNAERHDLAVADVSRKSKLLAKRLGCPVVLLSQLNRKCEERSDKRPMLSDLRDGGAVEQDANAVIFLYRDEVYNPDTEDKGIAEIIVSKHRGGPTGTARVGWIPSRTSFVNLSTDGSVSAAPAARRGGYRQATLAPRESYVHTKSTSTTAASGQSDDGTSCFERLAGDGLPDAGDAYNGPLHERDFDPFA